MARFYCRGQGTIFKITHNEKEYEKEYTYKYIYICTFSSVQSLSHVQLFVTPWTSAGQASLSFTIFQSLLKLKSIESVMSSNHLILCCLLFLLLSVFPSIRVFSNELTLPIRQLKYWSCSISPSNEYSELISFKIDTRVFSSTTIQKHKFFSAQPSLWSNFHICT